MARHILSGLAVLPILAGLLGLIAAFLWSFTTSWFFPDALPGSISLAGWARAASLLPAFGSSLLAGGAATLLATCLCLLVLQSGIMARMGPALHWMICIPLFWTVWPKVCTDGTRMLSEDPLARAENKDSTTSEWA